MQILTAMIQSAKRFFHALKKEFYIKIGTGHAPTPREVTIELNYSCQLRCRTCQLWTRKFQRARLKNNHILSTEELLLVISDLTKLGVKFLYFCGGEPFLRDDFLEIVRHAKVNGLHCSTISNGYKVERGLAEEIVLSQIDNLGISLDSARKEIHDKIRGVNGAFDRAIEAIRWIQEFKNHYASDLPKLFLNCTISSFNFLTLPELVDLASSLKIKKIHFNYLSVLDQYTVKQTNALAGEKLIGIHSFSGIPKELLLHGEQTCEIENIIKEMERRNESQIKLDMDPIFLKRNKTLIEKGYFPVQRCDVPWDSAMISPIGDVVPCAMFTDYIMGNLRERSFAEIWNNQKARKIRKILKKSTLPVCKRCCMVHESYSPLWKRTWRKVRSGFLSKEI